METRTVLLISRGTMTGGQMIGQCLERHEGIRCVTRENLLEAVNSYGDIATRVTARIEKAAEAYDEFSQLRRPYQILMKRALLEYARQGCVAYFGYSGHLLVDRVRHFVLVRLIAPMEMRIARARERLGYSDEDARAFVHRQDLERTRWARWMYGVDIRDPAIYDACVNMARTSLETTCCLLRGLMMQADFQPTPESLAQVENDYLATEVLAALIIDRRTHHLEISATVADGVLRLVGPYLSESEISLVRSIAASVPGIGKIEYQPGYEPAFRYSS
jgi:hypothetical protein